MMASSVPQRDHVHPDKGEDSLSALQMNASAVKAVAAAVASPLGPKGLDTMLVNSKNEVIVTNDGVTILDRMEVSHPAARMIVNVAKAQQAEVGDGTTTATLLAAALVDEGVKQVARGVPVAKVIEGIQRGVRFTLHKVQEKARPIYELDDEWLQRIAFTASRENEDITLSVIEAAHLVGREKLLEKHFKLSNCVVAHPRAESNVFSGILLNKSRMNQQMPQRLERINVLVLADSLKPEEVEEEARGTDAGFAKQEQLKEEFYVALEHLIHLRAGLIVTSGEVDPKVDIIFSLFFVFFYSLFYQRRQSHFVTIYESSQRFQPLQPYSPSSKNMGKADDRPYFFILILPASHCGSYAIPCFFNLSSVLIRCRDQGVPLIIRPCHEQGAHNRAIQENVEPARFIAGSESRDIHGCVEHRGCLD
jgi:hypothetical protein